MQIPWNGEQQMDSVIDTTMFTPTDAGYLHYISQKILSNHRPLLCIGHVLYKFKYHLKCNQSQGECIGGWNIS